MAIRKSAAIALACLIWTSVDARAGQMDKVTGQDVVYSQTFKVTGYLATPEGAGPFPAIVLIHEWWGLNDNIRQLARQFAAEGYVALAVDLYKGRSTEKSGEARKLMGLVRGNRKDAFTNLRDAVAFLKGHKKVQGDRLASVGWCFGGGWSYQMAKNALGTKASIIYYGLFNPKDDLSKMRARIIGHFAGKDRWITVDKVREFQVRLKTYSGDHEVYIYPNSDHAFAHEGGARYNKADADKAWVRSLAFLKKHL